MPLRETEAFVLTSQPLGESDRIVTFLTRSIGKLRGVAKGARRSRRRFGSNLEPMSRVRLTFFEREGSDLARIESADLLESFYRMQEDPERAGLVACLSEVAGAFAREQQEDEAFFRLLHAVLRAIRDGLDLDVAGRYFEIWTLRLHGILPDLATCGGCGRGLGERGAVYARRESTVQCAACGDPPAPGGVRLPAAALRTAAAILRKGPETLVGRPVPEGLEALGRLAQTIFLDVTDRRFRSYQVLEALRGRSGPGEAPCR